VTGAGAAVVVSGGAGPRVTAATLGRVLNMGLSDPFNMGAAMAPAAVDTIEAHFRDTQRGADYFDLSQGTAGIRRRQRVRLCGDRHLWALAQTDAAWEIKKNSGGCYRCFAFAAFLSAEGEHSVYRPCGSVGNDRVKI
jgi:hypothetical protein